MIAAAPNAVTSMLPDSERLIQIALRIGAVIVIAWLLQRLAFLLLGRLHLLARSGSGRALSVQRADTLSWILRRVVTTIIGAIAFVYALSVLGFDIRPVLAGAGLLGVAIGFGAQQLVRDFIAGIFILAEDQYAVGEVIELNGRGATVEGLSLRCTILRDFNGYLHFVPNGEMKTVTNRSRGWNRIAVDVPIGSDQDHGRGLGIIRTVVASLNGEPTWRDRLLDPVEVWGVETIAPNEAQVRLVLRGAPGDAATEVARELRRRLLEALRREGVRLSAARDIDVRHLQPAAVPAAPAGT